MAMFTLHIEHAITDYPTWRSAFERFADARRTAGVRLARVAQPVDDDRYVTIDLDFDTRDQAEAFRQFLHTKVWASPASAPALTGAPRTSVLALVDAAS